MSSFCVSILNSLQKFSIKTDCLLEKRFVSAASENLVSFLHRQLSQEVDLSPSARIKMPALGCRFYQHRFPEVEDVVMVNVRSIAEMGAYVSLLEYNNIEGMILLSELSRRRIRSINKLIRIGRNECVVVIRVDKEKGRAVFQI